MIDDGSLVDALNPKNYGSTGKEGSVVNINEPFMVVVKRPKYLVRAQPMGRRSKQLISQDANSNSIDHICS